MSRKGQRNDRRGEGVGFGGLLKGVGDLIEKLGDLAETGEQLTKSGEFQPIHGSRDLKGVYGFSVKLGLGDTGLKVEPFGNIHTDRETGHSYVREIREPLADVFDEEDYTLIVVEMPGISADEVQLDVQDDLLTVSAEKGDKKYRKEILLSRSYPREKMVTTCNNGILEIKCTK